MSTNFISAYKFNIFKTKSPENKINSIRDLKDDIKNVIEFQ